MIFYNRNVRNHILVGCVMALGGLIFMLVNLIWWGDGISFRVASLTATGHVISCEGEQANSCYPVVQFSTSTHKTITFTSNVGSSFFHRGEVVTVRYHASTPNDARIDSAETTFIPLGLACMGLLFLVVGLLIIRYSLRHRAEMASEAVVMRNWLPYLKFMTRMMMGIGGICICSSLFWFLQTASFYTASVPATGHIISCQEQNLCYPVVQFSTADHHTITCTSDFGSVFFHAGDTILVRYRASDPGNARLGSWELWMGPALVGILGLAAVVAGIFLWRKIREGNYSLLSSLN